MDRRITINDHAPDSQPLPRTPERPSLKEEDTIDQIGGKEFILYTETFEIARRKVELIYPVKETEFFRIEMLVSQVVPERTIYQTLWPLMAGISGSAACGLLALWASESVPVWVWIVTAAITIASSCLAIVFHDFHKREPDRVATSVADVSKELKIIKAQFEERHP